MNPVIQLSPTRKNELKWLGSYELDYKLLFECAYYPRPPAFMRKVSGCVKCSFDHPLRTCQFSHILDFSEYNPTKQIKHKSEVEKLLEQLSEEDRLAVREYLSQINSTKKRR